MQTVKKLKGMRILKKRSGRFAIQGEDNKWVHGPEKVKILSEQGLIKLSAPKKAVEPVVEAEPATEKPAE